MITKTISTFMKKLDFKSFDGKNHSNKYIHQYTYTSKKRVSFGCNTTLGKENSINNNEKINKFLSHIYIVFSKYF